MATIQAPVSASISLPAKSARITYSESGHANSKPIQAVRYKKFFERMVCNYLQQMLVPLVIVIQVLLSVSTYPSI